ncbi:hypothetical protein JCM16303_000646 [Sporobolomyces ruberrimus]
MNSSTVISRFGDREEAVKVEVRGTQTTLLRVMRAEALVAAGGGVGTRGEVTRGSRGEVSPRGELKRKRSNEQMSDDNQPLARLKARSPSIVKSIVGQLTAKSLATRQAGFALLYELVAVLSGGLESQVPLIVTRIGAALQTSDSGLSGAATQLKIEVEISRLPCPSSKIEVQRIVTVQTVGFVATSPVLKGPGLDQFVLDSLSEVSTLLRKVHRPLKIAAFETIDALVARAATSRVPSETSAALLQDLEPLLSDHDVNLLPHALDTTAGLLTADPSSSSSRIQETLSPTPRIYQLVESPLVQGPSLEGLLRFFQAYLKAGADPEPLVKTLSNAGSDKSKGKSGGEAGGTQSLVTASRCIGMIAKESNAVGDRVVKDNEKILKSSKSSPDSLVLAPSLSEKLVESCDDFSSHAATFQKSVGQLSAAPEDVRRSAAFATGNVAVGNTEQFLPTILEMIATDDKKRCFALQALKKVMIHSSPEALAAISDSPWSPSSTTAITKKNRLATSLPIVSVTSAHERATVVAASKFTFTQDSTSYDELLAPLIVELIGLMKDRELVSFQLLLSMDNPRSILTLFAQGIRPGALSSLNSGSHDKPHLIRNHLSTLLPELYAQSAIDKELIRTVEMGPFEQSIRIRPV